MYICRIWIVWQFLSLLFMEHDNVCVLPKSTEITLDRLTAANGSGQYVRHFIPNYGHVDCIFGKNAVNDVYPHILNHLENSDG